MDWNEKVVIGDSFMAMYGIKNVDHLLSQISSGTLGETPPISAKEAIVLVEWASECENADECLGIMYVLRKLGGIDAIRNVVDNPNRIN